MNASALTGAHRLEPLPNANDVFPADANLWFPATNEELNNATNPLLVALMNHYNLNLPPGGNLLNRW